MGAGAPRGFALLASGDCRNDTFLQLWATTKGLASDPCPGRDSCSAQDLHLDSSRNLPH